MTSEGIKDVSNVALKLEATEGWVPELVICSDAKRAQQTRDLFLSKFIDKVSTIMENKLYSGDSNDILCVLSKQESTINTMLLWQPSNLVTINIMLLW